MSRKTSWAALLALPVVAAGLVYGQVHGQRHDEKPQPANSQGYTCPITGEELPCPNCCPLNARQ